MSQERKERIAELRKLKPTDFVLRPVDDLAQGDAEAWAEAMNADELQGALVPARVRRMAAQAAYRGGWYATAPEGLSDEDFKLMPPALITHLGDLALTLYNDMTAPDALFT
jgi:hypothetical protein